MSKLTRPRYLVSLVDVEEPIEVTVTHADQLVGEATARVHGEPVHPADAPQLHSTLYVWCALRRMGHKPGGWVEFKTERLIGFEPVTEPDETGKPTPAVEPVDPTQPGQLTA